MSTAFVWILGVSKLVSPPLPSPYGFPNGYLTNVVVSLYVSKTLWFLTYIKNIEFSVLYDLAGLHFYVLKPISWMHNLTYVP